MGNYISKIQRPDGTVTNIKSYKTESIPMGKVASTSTSTVFTATIDGITELRDGVCVWLTNDVVASAANFTININGLGAKPVYRSMNAATRETTRFAKDYTVFLIYNETRVSGGCWDYVYGFDSNTTYTNMSQSEASTGTATTGRVISAKVLNDTIEEHAADINAVLPELVDEGAKNLLKNTATTGTMSGVTFTVNGDGTITANGTATGNITGYYVNGAFVIPNSVAQLSGCPSGGSSSTYQMDILIDGNIIALDTGNGAEISSSYAGQTARVRIRIGKNAIINNLTFKPMICTKAAYDISYEYEPYALPNPELTAAAIEVIDNGAKNEFCFDSIGTIINSDYICVKQFSANGVTFTLNADNTITATRTESSNYDSGCILMYNGRPAIIDSFFDATHILSGCPAGGTANTYSIGISTEAVGPDSGIYELGDGLYLPSKQEAAWDNMFLNIRYSSSQTGTITYKPMICTIPQWNISREYQSYALPNPELTAAAIEVIDNGAKNLLKITASSKTIEGVTFTVNADGTVIANGTATATATFFLATSNIHNLPVGKYILSGCTGGSATTYDLRFWQDGSTKVNYDGGTEITVGSADWNYAILIRSGQTVSNLVFKPMICAKTDWDVSQKYVSYALPNPELTAATIEMIDNGPKNLLNHTAYTRTVNKVTYTVNADRSITITSDGTNTQSTLYLIQNYTGFEAGTYVLSGVAGTTSSGNTYAMWLKIGTASSVSVPKAGLKFDYDGTSTLTISIIVRASQTVNATFKPMLCTKADWDISQAYQPYVPSNKELAESKIDVSLNAIPSGTTLEAFADSLPLGTHHCFYNSANAASDVPFTGVHAFVDIQKYSIYTADMTFTPVSTAAQNRQYRKIFTSGVWRDWQEFIGGTNTATLANNANLNDYTYACTLVSPDSSVSATIQNTPWTASGFLLKTINFTSSTTFFQFLLPNTSTGKWYRRRYTNSAWGDWKEYNDNDEDVWGFGYNLTSNSNLNDAPLGKFYSISAAVSATLTNAPWTNSGFFGYTTRSIDNPNSSLVQIAFRNDDYFCVAKRRYNGTTWGSWVQIGNMEYITGCKSIASSSNMNNLTTPGVYVCTSGSIAGTLTNCPYKSSGFRCDIIQTSDTNCIRQIIQPNQMNVSGGNARYERSCVLSSSTWSSWYKFEGTVVT